MTKPLSEQFILAAIANPLENEHCGQLHAGVSCNMTMLHQFSHTCQALYKMYLLVHLVPFLLFKRKKLKQKPAKELLNLLRGFIQSMLFAGGYTLIVRRTICLLTRYYKYTSFNGSVGAFLGGVTLHFEPKGRQAEIALFCANKTIETLYNMARRRNLPVRMPYGEALLAAVSVAIICFNYVDCPESIRDNYLKVLERIIGKF